MSEIFLINEGETLVPLRQKAYDSEDLLQTLLEKYPSLLAGDQVNLKAPRRWLLVKREAAVPGEEKGSGRWSLDHLFLDQEGVPTLVEVKRSTDTRIRREVVGQLLDYAANGVKYWPVESLRAFFEQTCETNGTEPASVIAELTGNDDEEEFWRSVKTNLQAGRIRMIFVADEIPDELRRVIEFLNEQMDPAEVLGVEIKQFANDTIKTLVPRLIGLTANAEDRKTSGGGRSRRKWDEDSFIAFLEEMGAEAAVPTTKAILEWAAERGLRIAWGSGPSNGSFFVMFDRKGFNYYTFAVFTGYRNPYVQFQFQMQGNQVSHEQLLALVDRLNRIPGVTITESDLNKYPSTHLSHLGDEENRKHFLEAWEWYVSEIERE